MTNYFTRCVFWMIGCFLLGALTTGIVHASTDEAERLYARGNMLFDHAKYGEAVECYEKAIELRKGFAPLYYNLAEAQRRLDEYEKAIRNFREYLRLRPDGEKASKARESIKELELKLLPEAHRRIVGTWLYKSSKPGWMMSLWKIMPDGTIKFTLGLTNYMKWKLVGDTIEIIGIGYRSQAVVRDGQMDGFISESTEENNEIKIYRQPWTLTRITDDLNQDIPFYVICFDKVESKCVNLGTDGHCGPGKKFFINEDTSSLNLEECRQKCKKLNKRGYGPCVD